MVGEVKTISTQFHITWIFCTKYGRFSYIYKLKNMSWFFLITYWRKNRRRGSHLATLFGRNTGINDNKPIWPESEWLQILCGIF